MATKSAILKALAKAHAKRAKKAKGGDALGLAEEDPKKTVATVRRRKGGKKKAKSPRGGKSGKKRSLRSKNPDIDGDGYPGPKRESGLKTGKLRTGSLSKSRMASDLKPVGENSPLSKKSQSNLI